MHGSAVSSFNCVQAELVSRGISPQAQEIYENGETSPYEDRLWRKICLYPLGQVWHNRVEAIVQAVTLHNANPGKIDLQVHLKHVLTWKHNAGLCIAPE